MKGLKPTLISILAIGLLAGSTIGAIAQTETDDASPGPSPESTEPSTASPFAATRVLAGLTPGTDPTSLAKGPFGSTVYIDRAARSIHEVQADGYPMTLAKASEVRSDETLAPPILAVGAGEHIIVFDANGRGWWNSRGDQSKAPWIEGLRGGVDFDGRPTDADTIDPETRAIASVTRKPREYEIYLVEPATGDIITYRTGSGGRNFVGIDQRIEHDFGSGVLGLYADPSIWVLTEDGVERPTMGGWEELVLERPPGPEPDYRYISGTDGFEGELWLYDDAGQRVVAFDKQDGSYLGAWAPSSGDPTMSDVRGMYVERGGKGKGIIVTWLTPEGVMRSAVSNRAAIKPKSVPHARGLKPSTRTPGPRTIDWNADEARLEADAIRLRAGGKLYRAAGEVLTDIDRGSTESSLENFWFEHGVEMRMFIYLVNDGSHWWIQEIWTYDGAKSGEWIEYEDLESLTRTPMGEALEGDLRLEPTSADRKGADKGANLRIDELRLTAFEPAFRVRPAPLTGCAYVPEPDAEEGEPPFDLLQGSGEPLEGHG